MIMISDYLLINGSPELSTVSNTGMQNKVRGRVPQTKMMLNKDKLYKYIFLKNSYFSKNPPPRNPELY